MIKFFYYVSMILCFVMTFLIAFDVENRLKKYYEELGRDFPKKETSLGYKVASWCKIILTAICPIINTLYCFSCIFLYEDVAEATKEKYIDFVKDIK